MLNQKTRDLLLILMTIAVTSATAVIITKAVSAVVVCGEAPVKLVEGN